MRPKHHLNIAEAVDTRAIDDGDQYIEVWNDLVSPRHLIWALVGCAGTTAVALLIATALSSNSFLWGLCGAVAGFVLCAVVIAPKRDVQIVATDDRDAAAVGPAEVPAHTPTRSDS